MIYKLLSRLFRKPRPQSSKLLEKTPEGWTEWFKDQTEKVLHELRAEGWKAGVFVHTWPRGAAKQIYQNSVRREMVTQIRYALTVRYDQPGPRTDYPQVIFELESWLTNDPDSVGFSWQAKGVSAPSEWKAARLTQSSWSTAIA